MKYSRHLEDFKLKNNNLKLELFMVLAELIGFVIAHHLLEAIVSIFGYEIEYVQVKHV